MGNIKRVVLLPLFFLVLMAGQDTVDKKDFKTTEAHYRLGDYKIVIRQQKRLKEISSRKELDTHVGPVWCSASIEIVENGKITDGVEYKDIWGLGWRYGIHLPIKQESSRHFIMVKYGDYDSRTLVITDKGELINLPGEAYRIFLGRYLIALGGMADNSHDFTIFDLHENKIRLTVGWGDPIKVIQFPPREGKAQIIKLYTDGAELFASIDTVKIDTFETVEHTGYFYKIDLETGKVADAVFDEKKHAEFVIDTSNVDLSNDCECSGGIIK